MARIFFPGKMQKDRKTFRCFKNGERFSLVFDDFRWREAFSCPAFATMQSSWLANQFWDLPKGKPQATSIGGGSRLLVDITQGSTFWIASQAVSCPCSLNWTQLEPSAWHGDQSYCIFPPPPLEVLIFCCGIRYTCGPTVYDSAHLGHARYSIFSSCFFFFLKAWYLQIYWAAEIMCVWILCSEFWETTLVLVYGTSWTWQMLKTRSFGVQMKPTPYPQFLLEHLKMNLCRTWINLGYYYSSSFFLCSHFHKYNSSRMSLYTLSLSLSLLLIHFPLFTTQGGKASHISTSKRAHWGDCGFY